MPEALVGGGSYASSSNFVRSNLPPARAGWVGRDVRLNLTGRQVFRYHRRHGGPTSSRPSEALAPPRPSTPGVPMTLTAPDPTTAGTERVVPRFVSVDDHIIEPAGVWQDRLPAKYKDIGPRLERLRVDNLKFDGINYTFDVIDSSAKEGKLADFWCYEDIRVPMRRIITAVGFPPEERTLIPVTYDEMRQGCWNQTARLEDMDANHTEASLCFPTFPRFCGQTFEEAKDKELALLCVQAYNDWMVDEWCGGAGGGRLIPLIIVPLWDADLAAAEVRRNAARG